MPQTVIYIAAMSSQGLSFAKRLALTLPPLITLNDHVMSLKRVEGESMQPTLNPEGSLQSDYIVVWKWGVDTRSFRRGELVSLRCGFEIVVRVRRFLLTIHFIFDSSPDEPSHVLVKRIIALEGDVVHTGSKTQKIPKGHCWIDGDNLHRSADSNKFGPVSFAHFQAHALFILSVTAFF